MGDRPALADVVDLALDGHEERLLRIGAVVDLELLLGDLAELNGGREGLDLLELDLALHRGGRSLEEAGDDVVEGGGQGQHGEEGRRRQPRIGLDRVLQSLPQLRHLHSLSLSLSLAPFSFLGSPTTFLYLSSLLREE